MCFERCNIAAPRFHLLNPQNLNDRPSPRFDLADMLAYEELDAEPEGAYELASEDSDLTDAEGSYQAPAAWATPPAQRGNAPASEADASKPGACP